MNESEKETIITRFNEYVGMLHALREDYETKMMLLRDQLVRDTADTDVEHLKSLTIDALNISNANLGITLDMLQMLAGISRTALELWRYNEVNIPSMH